MEAVKEVMW